MSKYHQYTKYNYLNYIKSTFTKWNFTRVVNILHKRCLWCLWQISRLPFWTLLYQLMALLDRFWTLLDQLKILLNQLGTLLDHLVALLDLMGTLLNWGAILANRRPSLQKENARNTRFTKCRNTVWKYEKFKNGVCYAIVPRFLKVCDMAGNSWVAPRQQTAQFRPNLPKIGQNVHFWGEKCRFWPQNSDFGTKI